MVRRRHGAPVRRLALVALVSACGDWDRVTAPALGAPPSVLLADWTPGPLGEFVLPAPPENNAPTATVSTGIVLPAGVPVLVTVSGKLTFIPNPAYFACPNTPAPFVPTPNPVGPAGLDNPERVRAYGVGVGRGDATHPPSSGISFRPLEAGAERITGFVQGPGVLWAGRPVVIPGAVGGPGCGDFNPAYFLTGSQTIAAEALAPPIVTPDKRRVPMGETVTFQLTIPWTTTFFVRGGWRWVPDTTTNTSALVGNCARQTSCQVVVRERGHVEVDDIVAEGGAIVLGARSPVVEVTPVGEEVRIRTVSGMFEVRPAGTGGRTTLELEVSVVDGAGNAIPNRTVALDLAPVEGSGAHDHDGARPKGDLRPAAPYTTGSSGLVRVTYGAPRASGLVKVFGRSEGAQDAEATITVIVPGLEAIPLSGAHYVFLPSNLHSSGDFYMAPGAIGVMNQIWKRYMDDGLPIEATRKFTITAATLVWGGLYDVHGNWVSPHDEHKQGGDIDFDDALAEASPKDMAEICRQFEFAGQKVICELHNGNHIHARLGPNR